MSRVSLLAILGCVLGCAESGERSADDGGQDLSGELERLAALGYVEASGADADRSQNGVQIADRASVAPGYRLFAEPFHCSAWLIDIDGDVVKSWHQESGTKWAHAELLPNGDLLAPVVEDRRRYVVRLSWDGEVKWEAQTASHHDVEEAPSGEILSLSKGFRKVEGFAGDRPFLDNSIVRISPQGEVLEEISLYDVLSDNRIGQALRESPPGSPQREDPIHANSVEAMRRPALAGRDALYSLDNVLIGCRFQRSLYVIDLKRRELVWAWGRGLITSPHDAQVLDSGNVLLIDNGTPRRWSQVVELDPTSREIVWTYGAESGPDFFFTSSRGSCQRLSNGNTLVSVSNEGEAFEVTADGRRVWKFFNPRINDEGKREVIVRMVLYPADYLEPGLISGT